MHIRCTPQGATGLGAPGLRSISTNFSRISSSWATAAYSIEGCKQLAEDAVYWERPSSFMGRVLVTGGKGGKE
jgi:hypothetical protein